MTTRKTLYTLSAAAMLLGAAPALADAGSGTPCGCPCGGQHPASSMKPQQEASAPSAQASRPVAQSDAGFLQQVWSAP